MTENRRKDSDYRPDPLEPWENRVVRRTVDDVGDINEELRFWSRVRKQLWGILAWIVGLPVALTGFWHALTVVADWIHGKG